MLLAVCMLVSLLTLFGCSSGGVEMTGEEINVYNWGEYIANGDDGSLDVIREFERETGIKVNYTNYASNEEMYAKLSSGAADYDVIIPSDYMIERMISEGMLEKLNFSNIPNFSLIDPQYTGLSYDPNDEYSVPYTWGTVGIFYNKTMVDEEDIAEQSWDILWNEKYSGDILMFDNQRDAFGIALMKLGYSQNSTNPDEWQEAYELLDEQKPLVQAYVMDQIFDKMANGEAALAPYYAGDARIMMEENEDIGFYVPKEGTNMFFDAMCIPKGSQNKDAAEKFINFMCDTDIALENIEYICYSTPHSEVFELLDEEIKANEGFYPPKSTLDKCEVFTDLPEDIYELMNDLWVKLKTQ
ncbi:MAG: spermidine/putrescine ABC transporter substrate-binding protein [Clostridia bacterium]|nr:spermidine/putrescine ABC transporter substrate-binding protein [Clostridia bacterium]